MATKSVDAINGRQELHSDRLSSAGRWPGSGARGQDGRRRMRDVAPEAVGNARTYCWRQDVATLATAVQTLLDLSSHCEATDSVDEAVGKTARQVHKGARANCGQPGANTAAVQPKGMQLPVYADKLPR